MKLSLNWLSDYVDLSGIPTEELVNRLTLSTCEVEEYEEVYGHLRGIVAGKIIDKKNHPDADRLSLCRVSDGKSEYKIVCGAPNAEEGLIVPLAKIGAKIPTEKGILEIKKSEIRGQESSGMLCSASELGLSSIEKETAGLLILPNSVKPGKDITDIYPGIVDTIIEIDNKSITHRPDLWCHFGFAREIAAIFGKKIKFNPLESNMPKAVPSLPQKKITIEKGAAKAYYGVAAVGVKTVPSPAWMRARLHNVGQKPINNIVDASNYTMLEMGQPNHTFDLKTLKSDEIAVTLSSKKNPNFTTLDGVERKIPEGSVLILDGSPGKGNPAALGGIMGGLESGISENTESLFIESATFHRENIRKTLSQIQLRTDSAVRFEKGQDPFKAKPALARIIQLIQETCPDLKTGKLTGESPEKEKRNSIQISMEMIVQRLGFPIPQKTVTDILSRLGFEIKKKPAPSSKKSSAIFIITAPTYRSQYDVTIPEDIVEELGRMYGYDNIKPTPPLIPSIPSNQHTKHAFERTLRHHAAFSGRFNETRNYSFASEKDNTYFSVGGIQLQNPVQADTDRMRVSLIPGILRHAALNQDRYDTVRLFEMGRIYLPGKKTGDLPSEKKQVALLFMPPHTKYKGPLDSSPLFSSFLEFRTYLERLIIDTAGTDWKIQLMDQKNTNAPYLHPGCSVEITSSANGHIGFAGISNPAFEKAFDLKRPCMIANLSFETLFEMKESNRKVIHYRPPSVYPDSRFEFSLVMEDDASTRNPVDIIEDLRIPEIKGIKLLTIYRGEPLEEGKKSASYEVICGHNIGTIPGDRLQEILKACVEALKQSGFPLR